MVEIDAGFVPVWQGDKLVGTLTDRDIAVRAIAAGKDPRTSVGEVMTRDVKYCYDDEDIDHICSNLADQQIRRIPVVDRNKRLVGVVSLGDLVVQMDGSGTGSTLAGITRPGGAHSQTGGART